jgi:hypothetical protein
MKVSVLLEPINGNGYRATGAEPLAVTVEAATRDEALAKFKEQFQERLRNGAELITLDIGPSNHPWMEFAGMFKDDPMLEEWKEAMADYRQKVEVDPNYL